MGIAEDVVVEIVDVAVVVTTATAELVLKSGADDETAETDSMIE